MTQTGIRNVPSFRSWKARLADRVGRRLRSRISLDRNFLLRRAEEITGLAEWGDESFLTSLRVLLRSYEEDARPQLVARYAAQQNILHRLTNRLRIEEVLNGNPEILEVPLRNPIFICGLPRTGTTFLQRLLACDSSTRTPQFWELNTPVPPPSAAAYSTDPRRALTQKRLERWRWLRFSPEGLERIVGIHRLDADQPEESWPLLQNSFMSNIFFLNDHVLSYFMWLQNQDMVQPYEYYRKQLQILCWRYSCKRLLLKSPSHLAHLDSLFEVFPDARIIWIHRNLLEVLPSSCSLAAALRGVSGEDVDLCALGQFVVENTPGIIDRALRVRDSGWEERFLDLEYPSLVANPVGALKEVYRFCGEDLPQEVEASASAWLETGHKGRRRRNEYSLEQFGLSADEIKLSFSSYSRRFNLD